MPPIHTLSYRGPLTNTVKLHFVAIPSVFEEIFVNESTDIKHTPGTFQRNIVIDANMETLSISFNVRKFVGTTDFCGYGGIRMFNHLNTTVNGYPGHNFLHARVPHIDIKQDSMSTFLRKASYLPICTNDSLIFEQKLYLDFGKTYFVFYDFNSAWDIDMTLTVHPSKYQALYNFEDTYCFGKMQTYIFDNFFIHCKIFLVRLSKQIPLILQWSRSSTTNKNNFECVWHGRMDVKINLNYMNLVMYNSQNEFCLPNSIITVTGVSETKEVVIGNNTQDQSVNNAESVRIKRYKGNCPDLDQSSYAIILTPSDVSRCFSRSSDFEVIRNDILNTNFQILTGGCISLDAILTHGFYVVYIMAPFYNIPMSDMWIYYSLTISKGCSKSSGMKVYFRATTSKYERFVYFEFSQERYHYIFHDYCLFSVLQFYLEKSLQECTADIEFTLSPYSQTFTFGRLDYFKVLTIHFFLE